MFTCDGNFGRMVLKNTSNYDVISSSVVIGALVNGDSLNLKPYLMAEIVNEFLDYDPFVSIDEHKSEILFAQSYPNPFINETCIQYQLQNPGRVAVQIFDAHARLVKTIFDKTQLQGIHKVSWDATNSQGEHIKPGIYFYQLTSGGDVSTGKMTKLE